MFKDLKPVAAGNRWKKVL